MPAAPKLNTPLLERLKPGKMTGWLPAIALFMCLSMFAGAALLLLQVGADPRSGPAPLVTSVSAQGFQGLRRLLDAEGHQTVINRFEDGGPVERGDLEIITLDQSYALFTVNPVPAGDSDADDEAGSEDTGDAGDTAAGEGESGVTASLMAGAFGTVPDKKWSDHVLYRPLAHAVLIIAPKWDSAGWPKNSRWAQAPELREANDLARALSVLSPVEESPTAYEEDGQPTELTTPPGREVSIGAEKTFVYDVVNYDIRRDARTGKLPPQTPNPNHSPVIDAMNAAKLEPVTSDPVLSPAPGETLFTAPIRVGKISGLQSIAGPNLTPVLVTADGRPVLSRVIVTDGRKAPAVPVYLLSDPDLLNNLILAQPEKVVNALALVDKVTPKTTAKSKIVFNMTFNGMSFDRNLFYALSRPPFVALPLAMLILGLALMWGAFARFGPAETAPAGAPLGRGVRTLADNAARLMALTLKEAKLGPAYATLMRDVVIRSRGYMQVDPGQSLDDLAERIGRTHGATDSYLDLRDRAARVATVHQLIDVTLKLHAWKTEIERAHI